MKKNRLASTLQSIIHSGSSIKTDKKTMLLTAFVINFFLAFLVFIPFVIKGGGLFTLCEDYNAETIPYSYLIHKIWREGLIGWSWNVDLGMDTMQALAAVGGLNPINFLLVILPENWIICANVWLLALRYALSGMFASLYLSGYTEDERTAFLGGILYAFSGFQAILLVFNLLGDAVTFFPFLLWSVDELTDREKGGWLCIASFICTWTNFSNFVGEVIFLAVYFCIRNYGKKSFVKNMIRCVCEGALGMFMAGIVLIPLLSVFFTNNKATGGKLLGANSLSFSSTELMILFRAVLFPAEAMSSGATVVSNDWTSAALYIPLLGALPCLLYLKEAREKWIRRMLIFTAFCIFVPFLNNMYYLEAGYSYRRWFFMAVLMMVLAGCIAVEEQKKREIKKTAFIYAGFMLCWGLAVLLVGWTPEKLPVYDKSGFILRMFTGLAGVFLCVSCWKERDHIRFLNRMLLLSAVFSVLTTQLVIVDYQKPGAHSAGSGNTETEVYNELIGTAKPLEDQEILPYRTEFWNAYYNYAMIYGMPCRTSFLSLVPHSTDRFYDCLGSPRDTAITPAGPEGTGELLSVRYQILDYMPENRDLLQAFNNGNRDLFLVENPDALPLTFAYNSCILFSEYLQIPCENRAKAMLSALVVKDEDAGRVEGVLEKDTTDWNNEEQVRSVSEYLKQHADLTGRNIVCDRNGMSCEYQTDEECFAFCSVPNGSGWKASVNGTETEILDINGFMAVRIPAGVSELKLEYTPVSSYIGIVCSLVSGILFVLYLSYFRRREKLNRLLSEGKHAGSNQKSR